MNATISLSIARVTLSRRTLHRLLHQHNNISSSRANNSSLAQAAVSTALSSNTQRRNSGIPKLINIQPQHSLLHQNQPHTNTKKQQQQQQRRSLFIQTATTPNPESLKFIPNGRLVLGHIPEDIDVTANKLENGDEIALSSSSSNNNNDSTTNDYTTSDNNVGFHITRKDHTLIARSPLAKLLFHLDEGIKSIYLGYDFITVTKFAEAHWQHLQTPIFGAIMDFYATNQPALLEVPEITDTTILEDDDEVVAMIKELLESRIRPAVQEDGGDIKYVGFEEHTGIVTVKLAGSCVGCPSSSVTLKNGVENMLMHYIPEVTAVISLEEEDDDEEENEQENGDVKGRDDDEVVVTKSGQEKKKKLKTYEERLAAAGIPFSD
jgi:Fe-S cluster biogenesis protein NfuA